jgi:hypothetical protein
VKDVWKELRRMYSRMRSKGRKGKVSIRDIRKRRLYDKATTSSTLMLMTAQL